MKALIKMIKGSKIVRALLSDRVINGGDGTSDVIEFICDIFGFDCRELTIEEFEEFNELLLDMTEEIEK